jgi:hypothetical protein
MPEPHRVDVSRLNEPGELTRLLDGPLPLVVTDRDRVVGVIEERAEGITAEEMLAFWESGGGVDAGMLDEIDALFAGGDAFGEVWSG